MFVENVLRKIEEVVVGPDMPEDLNDFLYSFSWLGQNFIQKKEEIKNWVFDHYYRDGIHSVRPRIPYDESHEESWFIIRESENIFSVTYEGIFRNLNDSPKYS